MLQAGIHHPQDLPGKIATGEFLDQSSPEPTSSQVQAANAAPVLSDAAASYSSQTPPAGPTAAATATEDAAQRPPARCCVFEVEVILTATGTKLTPSISHFLVGTFYKLSCLSAWQPELADQMFSNPPMRCTLCLSFLL